MKMLTVICLGTVVSGAMAADPAPPMRAVDKPLTKEEARFRALDRDNDRKLTESELRADATSNTEFAVLDADQDGFLSLSEFVSRPLPPAKAPTTNDR